MRKADCEIHSFFLGRTPLREHAKVIRQSIPAGVRLEAVSFWCCSDWRGDLVSAGVCVYRKGTGSEKRLVPVLKIKRKGDAFFVDGEPTTDPKIQQLYQLVHDNIDFVTPL